MIFIVHCAKLSGINGLVIDEAMKVMEFFMPWFFFKSGMFFKDKDVSEELKRNTCHLLKPFIIFSFIGWIIIVLIPKVFFEHLPFLIILADTGKYFIRDGSIRGNYALWFLLSLFIVKILFQLSRHLRIPILLVVFVSLSVALLHNAFVYNGNPVYIGNIANGLFYYSVGYTLKDRQFSKDILIISIVGILCIYHLIPSYLDFRANRLIGSSPSAYLFNEAFILCEIIIVNFLSYKFWSKESFISKIGRDTIIYYVTHYIVLVVCNNALLILSGGGISPYSLFSINASVLILSMFLVERLFRNYRLRCICF